MDHRPAWAEVDVAAIRHNVGLLRSLAAPARMCVVVKAWAYGHGPVPVARAALDAGASWLAVALVEEGAQLRDAGIDAPVLLLSEPPAEAMADVVALGSDADALHRVRRGCGGGSRHVGRQVEGLSTSTSR